MNNAGILTPGVWDQATFDQTIKVNVAGPVQLSQALLPLLSPGALVVMVSSGGEAVVEGAPGGAQEAHLGRHHQHC